MKEAWSDYVWLFTRWWFWLVFCVGAILNYYLFYCRTYVERDGQLFVRHGRLGKYLNLEEHLKIEHPEEWANLQGKKEPSLNPPPRLRRGG